jgi:hypothetical protein
MVMKGNNSNFTAFGSSQQENIPNTASAPTQVV